MMVSRIQSTQALYELFESRTQNQKFYLTRVLWDIILLIYIIVIQNYIKLYLLISIRYCLPMGTFR